MADPAPLQARIAKALSRVRYPRTGTSVLDSEVVRDIATTTGGKVRLTFLLSPGDDPGLAKMIRQAVEAVDGVTDVQLDVMDSASAGSRKAPRNPLPVMTEAAAQPRPHAPTPVPYPHLGKIIAISSGKGGVGKS